MVPLWMWGDGCQYLESGESITVVCCGLVLQRQVEKTTINRCFPLFLFREETHPHVTMLLMQSHLTGADVRTQCPVNPRIYPLALEH